MKTWNLNRFGITWGLAWIAVASLPRCPSTSFAFDDKPQSKPAAQSADDQAKPSGAVDLAGYWNGKLAIGAIELRITLKVEKDGDGKFKATLDSVDQNAKDLPVDSISVEGETVRFDGKLLMMSFEGKLDAEGKKIDGKFTQGGQSFTLVLERSEKPLTLNRPQEPKAPFPYRVEEVSYDSHQAEVHLAGTLTLPEGTGKFPAVVLVSGSGPQDRDESLLGHKPFLVLADYLTRRGIAVLRVDDRGVGASKGDFATATSLDFVEDVLGSVDFLKGRPEIDPAKIGLVGHSEGGLIAPIVASRTTDVAFIVLLAGPGVTGEQILYRQGADIARAAGAGPAEIEANRSVQEKFFAVLRETPDLKEAEKRLREIMDEVVAKLGEGEREQARTAAEGQMSAILSPWMRFFLTHDPVGPLLKVKCPVLAVNGAKDLQVAPDVNLPVIEKALKEAGNTDVTIRELPGLNHLLQTCETGGVSEYGEIEETMSPLALETVGDWLVAHAGVSKDK